MGVGVAGKHPGADEVLEANLAGAIVSCGGRPDLAAGWLPQVSTPTLLIAGTREAEIWHANAQARNAFRGAVDVTSVPSTTHSFDRRATLDRVADLAATWFGRHLRPLTATG